jgi:hypothetical protein
MENKKKPIVSLLRSVSNDSFVPMIDPDPIELSGKAFLTNPVASAQDCTGIAQRVPSDAYEAHGIAEIAHIPVTAMDETAEDKEMPPRDWVDYAN